MTRDTGARVTAHREWSASALIARYWWVGVLVVLAILVVLPLAGVIYGSFRSQTPTRPGGEFTLANWASIWGDDSLRQALFASSKAALGATFVALPVGSLLAFLIARTNLWGRRTLETLIYVDLLVSPFILATAWIALASPNSGLLNLISEYLTGRPLVNLYSYWGMVIVMATYLVPLVYSIVKPAAASIDSAIEEAAQVSGASDLTMLMTVSLPILRPALVGSTVLCFVIGIQMFSIPALIGAPAGIRVLAYEIYRNVQISPSAWEASATIGGVLLILSVALILIGRTVVGRTRRFVTTGRSRPRDIELGPARTIASVAAWGYGIVTGVLPFLALAISSFSTYSAGFEWTTELLTTGNFTILASDPQFGLALKNTLILMVSAAVVLIVVTTAVSIAAYWRPSGTIGRVTDVLVRAPIAMPGIVLGAGLLWVYLQVPLPIYGSLGIMILGVSAVFLPHIYQVVSSRYLQIDQSMREAAEVSGAGFGRTTTDIDLPIMRPTLVFAAIFALVLASTEVNAQILIFSPQSQTLPIRLWDLLTGSGGTGPTASALAMVQLMLTALIIGGGAILTGGGWTALRNQLERTEPGPASTGKED